MQANLFCLRATVNLSVAGAAAAAANARDMAASRGKATFACTRVACTRGARQLYSLRPSRFAWVTAASCPAGAGRAAATHPPGSAAAGYILFWRRQKIGQ